MIELNSMNQKGIAHILLIIILIIGIIAGVYLVQKTQIFKPKAASDIVEWTQSQGDSDNCITSQNGNTVTTCGKVKFKIFAPGDITKDNTSGSNEPFQGE